jgi:hypothetical protein
VPESQLDPTATDYGRVSHVHPWSSQIGAAMSITPAVPESQLDPTATADYSHLRH